MVPAMLMTTMTMMLVLMSVSVLVPAVPAVISTIVIAAVISMTVAMVRIATGQKQRHERDSKYFFHSRQFRLDMDLQGIS